MAFYSRPTSGKGALVRRAGVQKSTLGVRATAARTASQRAVAARGGMGGSAAAPSARARASLRVQKSVSVPGARPVAAESARAGTGAVRAGRPAATSRRQRLLRGLGY